MKETHMERNRQGPQQGSSRQNQGSRHRGQHRPHHNRRPRFSPNLAYEILQQSTRKIKQTSWLTLVMQGFLAGGLVTLGALISVILQKGQTDLAATFLQSIGLASGLFFVMASYAMLFTDANVIVPANLYHGTVGSGFKQLLKFWGIVWVSNLLGCFVFAHLLSFANAIPSTFAANIDSFMQRHLAATEDGISSMWGLMLSGILANWVIGIATMYASYNRAAMGKFVSLFVGVLIIVLADLQFAPISMGYVSLFKLSPNVDSWLTFLVSDIIPISVGNLIGGALLVSVPLLIQGSKRA